MEYDQLIQLHNIEDYFTKDMGLQIVDMREGYAKVKLAVEKRHMNCIGTVHGGCLFSIADSAAGVAASSYGSWATTVNGNISYLSPALQVKELIGEAKVVKHGKRISVFQTEIRDEEGNLLVRAEFTYYDLNKEIGSMSSD